MEDGGAFAVAPAGLAVEARGAEASQGSGLDPARRAPTRHRHPALQLVDGEVHAFAKQRRERAVEAVRRDQALEIGERTAGAIEQPPVRTLGSSEDGVADQSEEVRASAGQPAAHRGARRVRGHRPAREAADPAHEAEAGPRIA
jgi:hypothetical protein